MRGNLPMSTYLKLAQSPLFREQQAAQHASDKASAVDVELSEDKPTNALSPGQALEMIKSNAFDPNTIV